MDHIKQCSELTPGSTFKDHSWRGLGNHMGSQELNLGQPSTRQVPYLCGKCHPTGSSVAYEGWELRGLQVVGLEQSKQGGNCAILLKEIAPNLDSKCRVWGFQTCPFRCAAVMDNQVISFPGERISSYNSLGS